MTAVHRDDGFTLVEIFVVTVILGVLAGIAVPTFLGQRTKGHRAALVSDLRSVQTAQAAFATDGNSYTADVDELRRQGYAQSLGVSEVHVEVFDDNGSQYVSCVKHQALPEWLVYSSVTGSTTSSTSGCSAPVGALSDGEAGLELEQTSEEAVDEAGALLGGETGDELDGLADGDPVGDVVTPEKLKGPKTKRR